MILTAPALPQRGHRVIADAFTRRFEHPGTVQPIAWHAAQRYSVLPQRSPFRRPLEDIVLAPSQPHPQLFGKEPCGPRVARRGHDLPTPLLVLPADHSCIDRPRPVLDLDGATTVGAARSAMMTEATSSACLSLLLLPSRASFPLRCSPTPLLWGGSRWRTSLGTCCLCKESDANDAKKTTD